MIVIPMAGLSSRFLKAGYTLPKYMLPAHGKTLFEHSVESFFKYFSQEHFLFIMLKSANSREFVRNKCQLLGIDDFSIVELDQPTLGQAHTVALGLDALSFTKDVSLTIFNIDTFRPGFTFPDFLSDKSVDGYLETFIGSGKNWSNVMPFEPGSNRVERTAEKQEISEYCCTGLYYFSSACRFKSTFERLRERGDQGMSAGEYFIAPMYNDLIREGGDIRFSVIPTDEVIFCGVPEEYKDFCNSATV